MHDRFFLVSKPHYELVLLSLIHSFKLSNSFLNFSTYFIYLYVCQFVSYIIVYVISLLLGSICPCFIIFLFLFNVYFILFFLIGLRWSNSFFKSKVIDHIYEGFVDELVHVYRVHEVQVVPALPWHLNKYNNNNVK